MALPTGLTNVRLPGDIPGEEWDAWHTLVCTDEMSRVVRVVLMFQDEADMLRGTLA